MGYSRVSINQYEREAEIDAQRDARARAEADARRRAPRAWLARKALWRVWLRTDCKTSVARLGSLKAVDAYSLLLAQIQRLSSIGEEITQDVLKSCLDHARRLAGFPVGRPHACNRCEYVADSLPGLVRHGLDEHPDAHKVADPFKGFRD